MAIFLVFEGGRKTAHVESTIIPICESDNILRILCFTNIVADSLEQFAEYDEPANSQTVSDDQRIYTLTLPAVSSANDFLQRIQLSMVAYIFESQHFLSALSNDH